MRLGIQAILRYYATTSRTSESSPPIGVLTSDLTITLWKIQPKRLRHNGEGSTLLGNWGWPRGSGWEVKIWIETANRKLLHCGRSFKFFCERVERNYKATWPYLCYWSLSICPRKPGWSSFLLDCQEWCPNHTQRTVKVWPCFWPEQCCRACDQPKDPVSSSYEMWICQVTRWWERLNTDVIDTHLVISWRWIIHDYLEWSKMRKVCVCTHQSNAHSVAIASIYDLECHFYILHLWSFVNTVSWGKRAIAAAAPAPQEQVSTTFLVLLNHPQKKLQHVAQDLPPPLAPWNEQQIHGHVPCYVLYLWAGSTALIGSYTPTTPRVGD